MVLYDGSPLGADIFLYWTTPFMLDFCKGKIIALLMHIGRSFNSINDPLRSGGTI